MSGRINGVQAKLKAANPGSLFILCSNRALDLVLQEAAKKVRIIADATKDSHQKENVYFNYCLVRIKL